MYRRVNELLNTDFKSDFDINWSNISIYQKLSESFIREFKDRVNWYAISANQTLSESFMREFKDRIKWEDISAFQLLSWEFILEFKKKVKWGSISRHQPFIDPNYEKISKNLLKRNVLYHLYQQTKNRGWFVGYINERGYFYTLPINRYLSYTKKSKIYWKDLKMTFRINKFELIRRFKYV